MITPVPRWEEEDVETGRARLHVRRFLAGGPPIVLLHGLGVSGAVWQSFGRRLAPRWSAVAPDLRGHGQSEKPMHGYALADYAEDLDALFAALAIESTPVAGHSLGALVALDLAARSPRRASALVLLDPPLDANFWNPDIEPVFRLRHAAAGDLEAFLEREDGYPPLVARSMAAIFREAADGPFEALLDAPRGAPWTRDAAPAITVPVLICRADPAAGGLLGEAAAREFAARLPNGQVKFFAGAPHALHASRPAQVAEAILAFLEGK